MFASHVQSTVPCSWLNFSKVRSTIALKAFFMKSE